MRRVATAISKSWARIIRALAYYPLGFYLGLLLIVAAAFLYWAQTDLGWKFDWVQLQRWISNHAMAILALFTGLLGLVLIGSAIAYKQVIDLSKQEYVLWLHQRATKVLFPVFSPLHDWIRLRSRIYHWWHAQSFSNVTHYFLLIIAIGGLAKTTVNYISSAQASHGCSDAVTITVNTTWSTNQCHGDVVIRNGATLTINGGITADLSSLSVGSDSPAENGFIVAKGDTLNNLGVVLNVDGAVYVRASSSINADAQGYLGGRSGDVNGKGPGGATTDGTSTAGGGGYGGAGSNGSGSNAGGSSYGTLAAPVDLGSGGGFATGCCSNNGGDGGGAIKINAPSSTVTLNGTISANGGAGGSGCCAYAGGGSGGSIWVVANTLAGSGEVRAHGGAGGSGGAGESNNGGAGAGGRVQLTFSSDISTITKLAYDGGNNGANRRGAAGTVSTSSELIIANNASPTILPTVATPLSGSLSYANTTIKDNAYVTLASGANLSGGTTLIQNNTKTTLLASNTVWSGGSLTVQTGANTINIPKDVSTEPNFSSINIGTGTLQHDSHTSTHTYSLILSTSGSVTITGTINVDDKGYAGGTSGSADGKGPGGGLDGASNDAPGAGHGGTGGNGATVNGGASYGNLSSPTDLGSGGGGTSSSSFNNGGNGGGAVKITASSGTVTVNGTITANGSTGFSACCNYAGGGSGGSIWIIANTLAGSGTVRANGGAGGSGGAGESNNGGAGAGGRIQLTYSSDTSSITKLAFDGGNNGANRRGAAGTVSTSSGLTVANSTLVTVMPVVSTPISGTHNYPATSIKDYVYVTLAAGANLSGGTTTIENNTRTTLLGDDTVWTGGALTVQTGTNTINVKPTISTKPLFSSINFSSGNVYHDDHTTADNYHIILSATGNITVGTTINLTGLGFSGGAANSTGNGTGPGVGGVTIHAGGAHGGNGGTGASSGGAGGTAYGSTLTPITLGSGGGGAEGINGGDGGGGRIARHYTSSTYSGTVSVVKGSGSCAAGQNGTNQTVGAVTDLIVTGISTPRTAGITSSVVVEARDASNNRNYAYTKAITFTSTDSQATLPGNYTFTIADAGLATIPGVILKTAGTQTVTADQTDDGTVDGTHANITVNAGSVTNLVVSGVTDPVTAGTSTSPTVTAKDAYTNTVSGYTGTVTFTSSDSQATLPVNYTFVGGDAGVKTFTNGVVLKTTGVHSITASDGTISGTIQNINVTAGQPTKLKISNITSPIAANTPASPTVAVQDQYNNTATGYTGTITFSSSDAAATLPSNYAFSVSDQGVRTFTNGVTFATGGTHSLIATDVSSPTINGTLSSIVVTAAPSPGSTSQPSLTIVLIQPSEGTFFGTITQQVNGLPLEITVTGTVKGNQINGTVSGTYNEQPVTGTITGTVKGQKIESAILTLFNANDPGFNLTVVVGGVISPPDSPKQEPDCKLRGTLELTIDGKKFSGEVQLTISPDGSVTGRAKGFLDNDRVFGTFSASSVEGRLIGGTVTLTSNNNNSPITGEIIGSVRDGEIQLTNAEHCNISTDVLIDTDEDGDADGEGTGNVEIDEPVSSSDVINGSIIGTVEGQTANEDVIVNGLFEALVSDVVIKPTELKFETNEQNDLISGALAVVSGLSVLPILPAVQSILLTSSTRGFTFIHWFFFGYTPRKRRKFWGVIKDKTTGVPVAGVLVKLVDVHNDRVINQYRTDKTGRYGFLVETVGDYRITIIDPLYAAFSSKEFSVDSLKQPIVTGDIQLTPVHQRQLQLLNKTFVWVAAIKVLNIIHWSLLIGGTILSVMLVADHPTTLRTLIASLYSVLWLSKLLGYRRERHYGQVTDTDGAPLARAVVQLTNQSGETTAHIHSTVTDAKGRFVLLVKPGVYTVIVAKDGYKTRQGAVIADEANMTIRLERVDS